MIALLIKRDIIFTAATKIHSAIPMRKQVPDWLLLSKVFTGNGGGQQTLRGCFDAFCDAVKSQFIQVIRWALQHLCFKEIKKAVRYSQFNSNKNPSSFNLSHNPLWKTHNTRLLHCVPLISLWLFFSKIMKNGRPFTLNLLRPTAKPDPQIYFWQVSIVY